MNTRQWLDQLISYNTISTNSNKPLIEAVASWFKLHHIDLHIIPGPTDCKKNLLATIPASNGEVNGGILLSGHTDVVPVAGQLWNSDPFIAMEYEGRIFGRGSCDMKGFLAVLLALAPEFKKLKLLKPIHFAFTCDEEIGCIGVDYLVKYLQKTGIQPEGCIVGEPSNMRPITGEKARRLYQCHVYGKATHSSLAPEGCNAIEYASRLVSYITSLAVYVKKNGPFDPYFDIPFTTITTNMMNGGTAQNIIPGHCEFTLELRYIEQFPLENFYNQILNYISEELLPEMRTTYAEAAINFEVLSDAPGFNALDSSLSRIVRAVTGVNECSKVSYATESGVFQNAHIPTLICGPGSIEQAHRPNEYITIDQLNLCEKVLRNVIHFFCVDLNL